MNIPSFVGLLTLSQDVRKFPSLTETKSDDFKILKSKGQEERVDSVNFAVFSVGSSR